MKIYKSLKRFYISYMNSYMKKDAVMYVYENSFKVAIDGMLYNQNSEYYQKSLDRDSFEFNEPKNIDVLINLSKNTSLFQFVESRDEDEVGGGLGTPTTLESMPGTGESVVGTPTDDAIRTKRIKGGTNIALSSDGNEVTINATGSAVGEANTLADEAGGTGESIVGTKVLDVLGVKTIDGGTGINVTSDADTVTIACTITDTNTYVASGSVTGSTLTLTLSDASTVNVDVSDLLDNKNVSSGTITGTDLILTLSDASTVTVDVSDLIQDASEVSYDNSSSGLSSTNVNDALDELDSDISGITVPTAGSITSETSFGGTSSDGTDNGTYANADHTHGTPAEPVTKINEITGSEGDMTGAVTLSAGTGIQLTQSGNEITFSADTISGAVQDVFDEIALAEDGGTITGDAGFVAESANETLNLIAGNNITLEGNSINKSVTISSSGGSSSGGVYIVEGDDSGTAPGDRVWTAPDGWTIDTADNTVGTYPEFGSNSNDLVIIHNLGSIPSGLIVHEIVTGGPAPAQGLKPQCDGLTYYKTSLNSNAIYLGSFTTTSYAVKISISI